jgi:hypothetical protein
LSFGTPRVRLAAKMTDMAFLAARDRRVELGE